jgi:hypothetical protein
MDNLNNLRLTLPSSPQPQPQSIINQKSPSEILGQFIKTDTTRKQYLQLAKQAALHQSQLQPEIKSILNQNNKLQLPNGSITLVSTHKHKTNINDAKLNLAQAISLQFNTPISQSVEFVKQHFTTPKIAGQTNTTARFFPKRKYIPLTPISESPKIILSPQGPEIKLTTPSKSLTFTQLQQKYTPSPSSKTHTSPYTPRPPEFVAR